MQKLNFILLLCQQSNIFGACRSDTLKINPLHSELFLHKYSTNSKLCPNQRTVNLKLFLILIKIQALYSNIKHTSKTWDGKYIATYEGEEKT